MSDKSVRLQQFRDLRSSIRGSDSILVIGVDIAKEKHYAFFGTANGKTLWKKLIFDNSTQGFNKLLSMARDLTSHNQMSHRVFGLEPTASYHKPLAEHLIKQGEQVVYVSNVAAKNNRALLDGRWDKNDTKDAANIADLVGQGRCQFYDLAEDSLRELRSLIAYRAKLRKQEHALRMRIRNTLLAQYFPELDQLMPQSGQDNLILDIIADDFAPERIAAMLFEDFRQRHQMEKRSLRQPPGKGVCWSSSCDRFGRPNRSWRNSSKRWGRPFRPMLAC